jgi:glycosyltransferase involved in cell wall biosynthesis
MANQCEQLVRLLRAEDVHVELVRTNAPYQPEWIARARYVRALSRLIPFSIRLWKAAGRAQVMHILANSGWAWHLCASPAIFIARLRGTPVIVNYRGGNAGSFFGTAPRHVLRTLSRVELRVAPSAFLCRVFSNHGLQAEVIPNIVDLARFPFRPLRAFGEAPHIIVTRNLEPIYDIPTALAAFARIRKAFPKAILTVAGSGPELESLRALARRLGVEESVRFPGRIENADIAKLYAAADCLMNPSTVDNMPISILEAFASGVPVVSTDAGGIPDIVDHGRSGLLVPIGNETRMAQAVLNVLRTPTLAHSLACAGRVEAEQYEWRRVRDRWLDAYARTVRPRRMS